MESWKKWVVGIAMILSAVAGYLVATFDNDPATVPDAGATIEGIMDGVDVIRTVDVTDAVEVPGTPE